MSIINEQGKGNNLICFAWTAENYYLHLDFGERKCEYLPYAALLDASFHCIQR